MLKQKKYNSAAYNGKEYYEIPRESLLMKLIKPQMFHFKSKIKTYADVSFVSIYYYWNKNSKSSEISAKCLFTHIASVLTRIS